MKEFKEVVNAKKELIITIDNASYIKDAPEGFKEAVGYITSANESNKDIATGMAEARFKKDNKLQTVKIRIPCGAGKLDNLELSFQRERTFPNAKDPANPITTAYIGQKPKTRLFGTDNHMKELKERFKVSMAKL